MCASQLGSSRAELANGMDSGVIIEPSIGASGSLRHRTVSKTVVLVTLFFGTVCFALQGPFYPAEAARKGVNPTEYGFVFGVFQLIILLTCPLYGRYMKTIGSPFMFKSGVFVAAGCTIIFGFLDDSPPKKTFLLLSICVRMVAALGESAVYTSSYVIAIRCSSSAAIASAVAYVEITFGIGSILGPTVGGALYEIGGFRLPFVVTGSILMVFCFISMYYIREIEEVCADVSGPNVFRVIRSPSVIAFCSAIFCVAATVGFFTALLEPNVRPLGLGALQVGLLFMANGCMYAVSSFVWGRVVDKGGRSTPLIILGSLTQIAGLSLVGPMSFVPFEKSVTLVTIGLVLCGFGAGCSLVSSVVGLMDGIADCGYPKNMAAQGFVSGLYNAIFAAGCFFGPTIGGILFDAMGFPKASMVIWAMHIFTLLLVFANKMFVRRRKDINASSRTLAHSTGRHYDSNGSVTHAEMSYDNMTSSTGNGIKTIA